jgi:regulator of protease activity HflC (stomatin/prohibitin superfamily)
LLSQSVNIVQQGQLGVVKRLGEYKRTHEPGLTLITPFVESLQRVDDSLELDGWLARNRRS